MRSSLSKNGSGFTNHFPGISKPRRSSASLPAETYRAIAKSLAVHHQAISRPMG